MEFVLQPALTNPRRLSQVRALLLLGDKEFIPPLSSRRSPTQQSLSEGASGTIEDYFREMKTQRFVRALEGDEMAGFLSFRANYENPYLAEPENLYASTCVVHPAYRGRGLMTRFYLTLADTYPTLPIYTRTWHENFGHLKVLERLGFRCIQTLENDRGPGVHTVYYKREAEKP